MNIVREHINFERGLDPKKAMDIGKSKLDREIIENTDWAINLEKHGFIWEIVELMRNYGGFPILILKNKSQDSWNYRAVSKVGIFGEYQNTPAAALQSAQAAVDAYIREEERRITRM